LVLLALVVIAGIRYDVVYYSEGEAMAATLDDDIEITPLHAGR